MNKSLEELKAIRDGATVNDVLFDGRYLNSKMCARIIVDDEENPPHFDYDDPLYVDVEGLIPLSAVNRIIDLTEALLLISDLSLVTGDEGIQKHLDSLLTERNT